MIKKNKQLVLRYDTFSSTIESTTEGNDGDTIKMLLGCCMRYASIAPGGQQWCIPEAIYKKLEVYSKTLNQGLIECFASPINRCASSYYSLFPEDTHSGSLGNFFDSGLSPPTVKGLLVMNPPFTEFIINKLVDKILGIKDLRAVIVVPTWSDAVFYKRLIELTKTNAAYDKIVLKPNNYYYEDVARGRIPANFSSTYFLVGIDKAVVERIFEDVGYKL